MTQPTLTYNMTEQEMYEARMSHQAWETRQAKARQSARALKTALSRSDAITADDRANADAFLDRCPGFDQAIQYVARALASDGERRLTTSDVHDIFETALYNLMQSHHAAVVLAALSRPEREQ